MLRIEQPQDADADEVLHADRDGQAAGEPVCDVFDQGGIGFDEGFDVLGSCRAVVSTSGRSERSILALLPRHKLWEASV